MNKKQQNRIQKLVIVVAFILISVTSNAQYNTYVPQSPTEAMREVGESRQKTYDSRSNWIQSKINGLCKLIIQLFNDQTMPENIDIPGTRNLYRNQIVEYSNQISGFDFADDNVFRQIQTQFSNIEDDIYYGYNRVKK